MPSATPSPTIVPASDRSFLVRCGDEIGFEPHLQVRRWMTALQQQRHPAIRNLHPAYCTVLVSFDPTVASPDRMRDHLASILRALPAVELPPPRMVDMPVCYAPDFAPDLDAVAQLHGMSPEAVVALHSQAEYRVYFLGFSPGFPYMGGLPPALVTPRLAVPRTHVPAGSVAIAGAQAGIYPVDSPGGWRVIGRTPRRLFRPEASPPTLLRMGDIVHFTPVAPEDFECLAADEEGTMP